VYYVDQAEPKKRWVKFEEGSELKVIPVYHENNNKK
jgi:hypothetical protein